MFLYIVGIIFAVYKINYTVKWMEIMGFQFGQRTNVIKHPTLHVLYTKISVSF